MGAAIKGSRCAPRPARVMQCLLIVSMWHAPIPWLHAHQVQGPQVEHSPALHQHVDHFHARDVALGETYLELHAHWILPWQCTGDFDGSPPSPNHRHQQDEDFVLLAGDADSGLKSAASPAGPICGEPGAASCAWVSLGTTGNSGQPLSRSRGRHFFDTFARSHALRDLTCVRLC